MENYIKHIKYLGGYVLAVGAGCMFGTRLVWGTVLLVGAGYMAYSCCGKDGCKHNK